MDALKNINSKSIGLYFGSFNPIHNGHLIIAAHVLNTIDLKEIWFVISPQNPLKPFKTLLNEYQRLHLVRIAVEEDVRLKASDVEFKLPRPSYTIDTLTYLKEKHEQIKFFVILGSDSLQNINKWKNYRQLIDNEHFIVYKRPGFEVNSNLKNIITLENSPMLYISSSFIRNLIIKKKNTRYFLPDRVREEIERNGYYRTA